MPQFSVCLADWHFSMSVGRYGFTVGPRFLSLDVDGDIARQIIAPPKGYNPPLSDIAFEYHTS